MALWVDGCGKSRNDSFGETIMGSTKYYQKKLAFSLIGFKLFLAVQRWTVVLEKHLSYILPPFMGSG